MEIKLSQLNDDQKKAIAFLDKMLEKPMVVLLKGAAGTGKSTVVKAFKRGARTIRQASCALSAKAALNVNGSTLARVFGLTNEAIFPFTHQSYKEGTRCNLDKDDALRDRLKLIDLLIIDEVSMVRCDMLDCIHLLLQQAKNNDLQFGGISVLLVGDFNQLPAFCAPSKTKDISEQPINILKTNWPKAFKDGKEDLSIRSCEYVDIRAIKVFELKKLCRQKEDDKLSYFLKDVISAGKLAQRHIDALMLKKVCDEDIYQSLDTTILAATNKLVEHHNIMFLSYLDGDVIELRNIAESPADKKRLREFNLPEMMCLKKGAKLVFCLNDPLSKELHSSRFLNGQTATFLDYDYLTDKALIKLHDKERSVIWIERESHFKNDVIYDAFFDIPTSKYRGKCKAFPFVPGFAMTVHKAQGMTIEKLCIDFNKMNDINMIYTALSRVKTWENLSITEDTYLK